MLGVRKTLYFYKCMPRVQLDMSLPDPRPTAWVCVSVSLVQGDNRLVQYLLTEEEELCPFAQKLQLWKDSIWFCSMFAFVAWHLCWVGKNKTSQTISRNYLPVFTCNNFYSFFLKFLTYFEFVSMRHKIKIYFNVSMCVYSVFSTSFVNATYPSPFYVLGK